MKYTVKVPPTKDQGSYTTTASASLTQTLRGAALQDYNSARAHDGLPAVSRMPAGTLYVAMYEYSVQMRTSYGWEDVCTEDKLSDALKRKNEYIANQSGSYRIKKNPVE